VILINVNTVLIMLAIFILIYIAMFAGYQIGKKHGAKESIFPLPPSAFKSSLPKDEKPFHERDPWDEQRIDIPDETKIIQTLGEEKINE
jgi:hypothetical protein